MSKKRWPLHYLSFEIFGLCQKFTEIIFLRCSKEIFKIPMAVVAKKDIENLTKQVLNQKRDILEAIEQEHVQIDSSLLHEKFFPEFTQKSNKIIEPQLELINGEPLISLNDMEALIRRFDELDKVLSTSKIFIANNNLANTAVRKENHGIKRKYNFVEYSIFH